MRSIDIFRRVAAAVGLALVVFAAGCSTGTGQYAPVKRQWDSPHSSRLQDELRNRLEHTQHDH